MQQLFTRAKQIDWLSYALYQFLSRPVQVILSVINNVSYQIIYFLQIDLLNRLCQKENHHCLLPSILFWKPIGKTFYQLVWAIPDIINILSNVFNPVQSCCRPIQSYCKPIVYITLSLLLSYCHIIVYVTVVLSYYYFHDVI